MAVERDEVDGVPAFWVPAEGPLRASLVFRTGQVDEPLHQRGWTHLLEHLALHGRDSVRRPVNGSVSTLWTSFDVMGEPDEVAELLSQVAGWLADPVVDDVERESRVLRAETSQRGQSPVGLHLLWRFGARGPGVIGYDELGLRGVVERDLRDWAAQVFVRENAALALSGPVPAGLGLRLPAGAARPVPVPEPCEQRLPGCFGEAGSGLTVSGLVERSTAATTFVRVFQRALQSELRGRAAASYGVHSFYDVIGTDTAVLTWAADLLPDAVPGALDRAVAVLRHLRDNGPDPQELRDDLTVTAREMARTESLPWQAWSSARELHVSRQPTTVEQLVEETLAVQVDDVRAVAGEVYRTLIVGLPPEGLPANERVPVPALAPDPGPLLAGGRHRAVDAPFDARVLHVSAAGVSLETGTRRLAASVDDVEVVMAYPDGARGIVRRDGYQVWVEPGLFRDGADAVRVIDSWPLDGRHVPMDARPAGSIPQPTVTRWMRLRHLAKTHSQLFWAVLLIVLGVLLLFANHGGLLPIVVGVVLGWRHLSERDARSSP